MRNTTFTPQAAASARSLQFVSFKVGKEDFGLDILQVQEIIRWRVQTRVPNMPDFVEGVVNLRGQVVPVISLRRRLGISAQHVDKHTRIIVAEVGGNVLGFVVDEVSEVFRMSPESVEPPPRLGNAGREYVRGIGKIDSRLVILIDLERVLAGADEPVIASPKAKN